MWFGCGCPSGPELLLVNVASRFHEQQNIGIATGSPWHPSLGRMRHILLELQNSPCGSVHLRETTRRVLFFGEPLALSLSQISNYSCFLLVSGTIWATLRVRSCLVAWLRCAFVGRAFTHLYPSNSLVLKICNLVVPIHSSESNHIFTLRIATIGQRVLGSVVNSCSTLPHHDDAV